MYFINMCIYDISFNVVVVVIIARVLFPGRWGAPATRCTRTCSRRSPSTTSCGCCGTGWSSSTRKSCFTTGYVRPRFLPVVRRRRFRTHVTGRRIMRIFFVYDETYFFTIRPVVVIRLSLRTTRRYVRKRKITDTAIRLTIPLPVLTGGFFFYAIIIYTPATVCGSRLFFFGQPHQRLCQRTAGRNKTTTIVYK